MVLHSHLAAAGDDQDVVDAGTDCLLDPYWMPGLSITGIISFGWDFVAGKKRVPSPADGRTAVRTFI